MCVVLVHASTPGIVMWLDALLAGVESSGPARAVADSRWITAALSAAHVIGFSLVIGGALLSNLRLVGVMFRDQPVTEVMRPATGVIGVGLVISVATGAWLFAARATTLAANPWFRAKLLLLLAAVAAQVWMTQPAGRQAGASSGTALRGAFTLVLWTGLAGAACAVILLE